MMVCITGTPGTGKTKVSQILKEKGYEVKNFIDVSKECISGILKDELIVDEKCLRKIKIDGIIEGHLSHYMKCDIVFVLRSHLKDIEKRLKERKYEKDKIMDNIEAESIDVIGQEAKEIHGEKVYEIMNENPMETAEIIDSIIKGKKIEKIYYDLSEEILNWY